jgi:hypothetical protein
VAALSLDPTAVDAKTAEAALGNCNNDLCMVTFDRAYGRAKPEEPSSWAYPTITRKMLREVTFNSAANSCGGITP